MCIRHHTHWSVESVVERGVSVYYEPTKRELNKRLIYECRCDERLKVKPERFTNLGEKIWSRFDKIPFLFFKHVCIQPSRVVLSPVALMCHLVCRCEHCGITCGTRHVHVRWRNLCVYEQVTSPKLHRITYDDVSCFVEDTLQKIVEYLPYDTFTISMVHHDDIYVVSFDRIFVCEYV